MPAPTAAFADDRGNDRQSRFSVVGERRRRSAATRKPGDGDRSGKRVRAGARNMSNLLIIWFRWPRNRNVFARCTARHFLSRVARTSTHLRGKARPKASTAGRFLDTRLLAHTQSECATSERQRGEGTAASMGSAETQEYCEKPLVGGRGPATAPHRHDKNIAGGRALPLCCVPQQNALQQPL